MSDSKPTVPLYCEPGTSMINKTGSWRTLTRPRFIHDKCVACNMCAIICPEGCITGVEKNSFNANFAYCKGCGLCAAICPVDDIEMVPEEGAK